MHAKSLTAAVAMILATGTLGYAAAPVAPAGLSAGPAVTLVAVDCHADARTHFLPQFGGPVRHHHQGNNCAIVVAQGGGGDCHHDVRRHFLPGHGKVWHRHGPACGIQIYPAQGGPSPGIGGCIQVGPSTICGFSP